ncbi:hypothetical protein [Rubrivirga marina]|uniref:hypothetical protein n=1 Tax=Rubrivirga marina TaxID=1196024 RepID=UPI0015C7BA4E|nr:hypothetical protein [Rubrivirga marina]
MAPIPPHAKVYSGDGFRVVEGDLQMFDHAARSASLFYASRYADGVSDGTF